jgi:hypothetical protein
MADLPTDNEVFQQALAPEPTPTPEPASAPSSEPPQPSPPSAATPQGELPLKDAEGIPSWRLREEAEARRQAEDRARQLEERLNQLVTHVRQGEKQPDFFEDPNKATTEILGKMLQPFVEETRRQSMYNSRMIAETVHTPDAVSGAEQAFLSAMSDQSLDPVDYERVVQSPNRYDEVVKWHKRQNVLTSVGDDPNAWFESQLEARLADPQFQAQMLEKVRGGAARRPPVTELPPSLSNVTAARGNAADVVGDLSDASLWASVMGPPKR